MIACDFCHDDRQHREHHSKRTRGAVAAEKKCKKRHSAKKKCARKKRRKADAPNSPVIRATLTWGNGASEADVDLYVFDANGNQAGNGSNMIPLTSFSGDVSGPAGSETFTDASSLRRRRAI